MARPLSKSLLLWTRTLHIYATMLALVLLIFFSFTGFVMNHPKWFGIDRNPTTIDREAVIPMGLVEDDGPLHVLKIVEHLRAKEGARGEMLTYEEEDPAMTHVAFTGAGRKVDFFINKDDGKTKVSGEIGNSFALMADLHKGVGTGGAWRLLIDGAAIFLMFASLSGVVLWISLPKRRTLGIVSLGVSVVLCGAVYFLMVP